LNEAWSTSFWSQRYSDWAQILPPRLALSDRLQPAYQKVLERNPEGGVGSGQGCS
jgi:beta-galactosidase GanA